ncbi:MAG: filamentous hemagglutinin N-terminal domain-containing protein, partial [Waterburya sp.]
EANKIFLDGVGSNRFSSAIGSTMQGDEGNAGNIKIIASELSLNNGATILASTFGSGDAGNITLEVDNSISLSNGSLINSTVSTGAIGDGGSVVISASDLFITNGAAIFTGTLGEGNGGDLTFHVSDRLYLEENSTISAQVIGTNANGGDITINAEDGFVVAFPNQNQGSGNDIVANSPTGEGGDITINAQGVLGLEERGADFGNNTNDIDASGTVDGVVEINTPNSDAIEGATKLPNNPVEAGETVTQACVSARGIGGNNLVVTGKGGIPSEPTAPLVSELINVNGKTTQAAYPQPATIKPIRTSKGNIIPAQGIEIKEDGRIILTAYPTSNNSRTPQIPTSCGKS